MSENNYLICPKCKKKYHVKSGSICAHCNTDIDKYKKLQEKPQADFENYERQKAKPFTTPGGFLSVVFDGD